MLVTHLTSDYNKSDNSNAKIEIAIKRHVKITNYSL